MTKKCRMKIIRGVRMDGHKVYVKMSKGCKPIGFRLLKHASANGKKVYVKGR